MWDRPTREYRVCQQSGSYSLLSYETTYQKYPLCNESNDGSKGSPPTRALVASCAKSSPDSAAACQRGPLHFLAHTRQCQLEYHPNGAQEPMPEQSGRRVVADERSSLVNR